MSEPIDNRSKEILTLLLTAPDSQLDKKMVERMRRLLNTAHTREELKNGLKDILDLCAHGSLASSFVMKVLHHEWKRVGGKDEDPVSEEVKKVVGWD